MKSTLGDNAGVIVGGMAAFAAGGVYYVLSDKLGDVEKTLEKLEESNKKFKAGIVEINCALEKIPVLEKTISALSTDLNRQKGKNDILKKTVLSLQDDLILMDQQSVLRSKAESRGLRGSGYGNLSSGLGGVGSPGMGPSGVGPSGRSKNATVLRDKSGTREKEFFSRKGSGSKTKNESKKRLLEESDTEDELETSEELSDMEESSSVVISKKHKKSDKEEEDILNALRSNTKGRA